MSLPAEQAVRAWANSRTDLVGNGAPVSQGFYLLRQRSPASGQYGVMSRQSIATATVTAENAGEIDSARISTLIYGGTQEAAEDAAAAFASAVQSLTGRPVPCGDTGVLLLVHDNLSGPMFVPMPETGGEQFAFEVAADFILSAS